MQMQVSVAVLETFYKSKRCPSENVRCSESKIGFENRDPGFELKTETGFQNWWKPVFKDPKIA